MARAFITQAAVFEAADALAAAGAEPTIITVQERIGGGSYTTVKRYLEEWKDQRQTKRQPVVEVPEELAAKSAEFVRALWATATALADGRAQQARAEAQRQVEAAHASMAEAEAVIARLEAEAEEQAQRLAGQEQTITQLRAELDQSRTAAQVAEARVGELSQRLDDLKAELAMAHRQLEAANARGAQAGDAQLADELAAIRQQLQEQAATIARWTGRAESDDS